MANVSSFLHFHQYDDAPVIDSFKIRIPIGKVKILNNNINTHWSKVNEYGEVIEEGQNKALRYNDNGISLHFKLETQLGRGNITADYLSILVNSKTLQSRYFEGITRDNIQVVYDYIMSKAAVDFTMLDFLMGECTDMDFKKDCKVDWQQYKKTKKVLVSISKMTKKKGDGHHEFNAKNNDGIQWSDRETTRFLGNPFFKIYHKETELLREGKKGSKDFYDSFLKGVDIEDRVRIETTVKNKKHFRALGIQDTTLSNLLDLTPETRNNIIQKAAQCHLEARTRTITPNSDMTPNKKVMYAAIIDFMDLGRSYETIRQNLIRGIDDRSAKSKKGKELDDVYMTWIHGSDVDMEAKDLNQVLDFIGCP